MTLTPVKIKRRQKETTAMIGAEGEIILWTMIRVSSNSFSTQAPYPVVIVNLLNGQKTIGQLVDWQEKDLQIGQKVTAVLRRMHDQDKEKIITYSIKFKPL